MSPKKRSPSSPESAAPQRGRPALPDASPVLVRLSKSDVKTAKRLGKGVIAEGVREALSRARIPSDLKDLE